MNAMTSAFWIDGKRHEIGCQAIGAHARMKMNPRFSEGGPDYMIQLDEPYGRVLANIDPITNEARLIAVPHGHF